MKRAFAFILSLFAVLLPWRLRIGFAALLGWSAQGVYWVYSRLIGFIIKNLQKAGSSK